MISFSVLLSVYIKEDPEYLNQSLKSILAEQSVVPSEVIIIKDGKLTKELEKVLGKYATDYSSIIKIFGYEINQGLGYALNYGLNKCNNEIIFRMDTDDISSKDRFKIQLKEFKANNSLVIIGSNIEEFNNTPGDLKLNRNVPLTSNDIDNKKYKRNPFNHMTVGFKKSIINKVGGYKDMPGYEDYYLWLRVLKEHKGFNINENLVFARTGNDMIGRRQGFSFYKKEIKFQNQLRKDGLIGSLNYFQNIVFRAFPRLLPKKILKIIYINFLRK